MITQYAVLTECSTCSKKEIWYMNTESEGAEQLAYEVYENMQILYNSGFHCAVCKTCDATILAIKEASEDPSESDF